MPEKITGILIANRGEIALRIIRTARKMGIRTTAVYAANDADSAHVHQADEHVLLPGNTIAETYLNIEAVIDAARQTGADAIHPGYGFLSENPLLPEACEKAGILFIGPSAEAMRKMGNKIAARTQAELLQIPVSKGLNGSPETLLSKHPEVGFPLLIKAAAGGGGKGMRVVRSEEELVSALEATSREALAYFGDGTVYVEKFLDSPRHIEVQVLGDTQGNTVHLFERECSLQRRHQKIVEEAPSPTLSENRRTEICNDAVKLASAIGYVNAGTVEFLLDTDNRHYFLEMNTRIQVEHPVTELTTGIDIVEQQIRIAQGEPLGFIQQDLKQTGHAIECRVYAEDPKANFLPSPGKIAFYQCPDGEFVRNDSMELVSGDIVSGDYDPMISKLIVWGEDRESARNRMIDALNQYVITGIKTNLEFLAGLMHHPDYVYNQVDTKYIDKNLNGLLGFIYDEKKAQLTIPLWAATWMANHPRPEPANIWETIGNWQFVQTATFVLGDKEHRIVTEKMKWPEFYFSAGDASLPVRLEATGGFNYSLLAGDAENRVTVVVDENQTLVKFNGYEYPLTHTDLPEPEPEFYHSAAAQADPGNIVSPMPGKVIDVRVMKNQLVKKGDVLLIVEAMKMENSITSPIDARVDEILVAVGDKVDASGKLIHLSSIETEQ